MKKLYLLLIISTVLMSGFAPATAAGYKSIPQKNVVTVSIQKKIANLRPPVRDVKFSLKIGSEKLVPLDALKSISLQHKYMAQAFPEAFEAGSNSFYIFMTRKGARAEAIRNECNISDEFKDSYPEPPTMNSITQPCGDQSVGSRTISFLNWPSYKKYDPAAKRVADGFDMWAFQAGQEGDGSLVQGFYYKGKNEAPNGNPMPAWYEQGGQFALSSIALAVEKRQWRQSSLIGGRVDTCGGLSLKATFFYNSPENNKSCHYQLGSIASELMVALYGFDAPILWLQNATVPQKTSNKERMSLWKASFKSAYGDSLDAFIKWSDAYALYLSSNGKQALPRELLARIQ